MERDTILVYLESTEAKLTRTSLEAVSAARHLAAVTGGKISAVLIGDVSAVDHAATYGVDTLLAIPREAYQPEEYAVALSDTFDRLNAAFMVIGSTQDGKDLAARVAAHMDVDYLSNIQKITSDGYFTRAIYGGALLETVSAIAPAVISIRPGSFDCPAPEVVRCAPTFIDNINYLPAHLRIKDIVEELSEEVDLNEADVIVAGGRGMGSQENFRMIHELADLLNGAVGASRPAVEEGWISHRNQVGQSGKIVSPKIYIACGISGATQHISGIMNSDFIVAINKDINAPIFNVADIGIVGDVGEILPAMIAELRARKA